MATIKGRWRWYDGIENAPAPTYLLLENVSFISGGAYGDGSRTYGALNISSNNIGGNNRVSIAYMFADDPSSGYTAVYSSINSGEIVSHVNENMRIMDFGETEQEVSEEIYNFLVANAAECLPTIAEKLTMIAENEQKVYDAAYEKGHVEGKQAEYDAFWDTLQNYGNRTSYQYAFANGTMTWTDEIYNPKYPIICSSSVYAATNLFWDNRNITDTKVPIILRGARADNSFGQTPIKRIPSLTLENVPRFSQTFKSCNNLETLIVRGTIEVDGFNVGDCTKLSRESIESIVYALSKETSGLAITFSKAAVDKAFETSEGANDGSTSGDWAGAVVQIYRPNWHFSLV